MRTSRLLAMAGALSLLGAVGAANAIEIQLQDFTNGGPGDNNNFFATVTIEDLLPGKVRVEADIRDNGDPNDPNNNSGLEEGDVLSIFFDLLDPVDATDFMASNRSTDPNAPATNDDGFPLKIVAAADFKGQDNVNGGGNGLAFDFLVETGTNGAGPDGANQFVAFTLMNNNGPLSAASFVNRDVGLRVQSISGKNLNFASGSSKLVGNGSGGTPVPSPAPLALLAAGLLALRAAPVRRRLGGRA